MKKVVVTGGSGASGSFIVRHLIENGYEVLNIDVAPPKSEISPFLEVDLTDYGTVFTAMHGYDAVVHFGANPNPDFDFLTGASRFKNNTLCTYNVFQAAVALGMEKVVWASSETVLGFPFDKVQPDYVPIDEAHKLMPQNSYALSKVVCEELARQMNTLYGIPIMGLRLANILYTGTWHPHNYDAVPSYWDDGRSRSFNLWSYIDARDVCTCVQMCLESDIKTAESFIIAANDTIMNWPSRKLIDEVYPDVTVKEETGEFESLLSTAKAKEMLGFVPQYSWRNEHPDKA